MPERHLYLKILDSLSRIRDKCQGKLDLPQICVVGDQTSGKSSLLQCLTGVPFPVKSGICTRAPTVVQCRRSNTARCEIRGSPDADFEEISFDEIDKAISKAQKALLPDRDGPKVSKKEITLRISGSEQIDIQIVDLPGIIHNGDGKEETLDLINSYIASPQTLILLVSEAKQDDELTSALGLAAQHDQDSTRTLRVLTKFDTFDSDDARNVASQLVIDKYAEPLGAHAVICRANGDATYDEENENEEFRSIAKVAPGALPADRQGVPTLKMRLPDLYSTLVRTNLKGLEVSAQKRINVSLKELRKLGERPLDDVAMLRECQRVLNASPTQFQSVISPAFFRFQEAVHATGDRITPEFIALHMMQDAFQCPFFQGEAVFARCMREVVEWWREPARRLEKEIRCALAESMAPIEEDGIGISKKLRAAINERWVTDSNMVATRLAVAFKEALDESVPFGTANHYLYDKYVEEQVMPDAMIDEILHALNPSRTKGSFSTNEQTILNALRTIRETAVKRDCHKALHEHVAKRTLNAVKAAWAVEKKTVTDAILKKTRDVAISARVEWISTTLLVDSSIRSCAVEDEDVGAQREYHTQVITAMSAVLAELAELANEGGAEPSSPGKKRPLDAEDSTTSSAAN